MEKIRRYGLTKTQIEELSNFCKENIDPIKEKYNKINKDFKKYGYVFGPDKQNRTQLREIAVLELWNNGGSVGNLMSSWSGKDGGGVPYKEICKNMGIDKPTYKREHERTFISPYIRENFSDLWKFLGFEDGKEPFEKIIGNRWEGLISMLRNKNLNVSDSEVHLGDKSFNILSLWEVKDYHKFWEDMTLDKIPDDIFKVSKNIVKSLDGIINENPEKKNRLKFILNTYIDNYDSFKDLEGTQYINKLLQEVDFFDIDKKEKEETERLKRLESLNTDIKVIKQKISELKMKVLKLEDEKLNGTMSVENFNIHMKNIKDMEVGLNNLLKEKMNYHE